MLEMLGVYGRFLVYVNFCENELILLLVKILEILLVKREFFFYLG